MDDLDDVFLVHIGLINIILLLKLPMRFSLLAQVVTTPTLHSSSATTGHRGFQGRGEAGISDAGHFVGGTQRLGKWKQHEILGVKFFGVGGLPSGELKHISFKGSWEDDFMMIF